ncbi:hypothetical protein F4680DRAFT_349780 [Xylaria scruposa]|nr:hypothetical protein F4680DRAFT_349780 [Xylaria scruposa]
MPKLPETTVGRRKRPRVHTLDSYDILGFMDERATSTPPPAPLHQSGVNPNTEIEHTRRVVTQWQEHEDFGVELDNAPPDIPDDISPTCIPDDCESLPEIESDTLAITRNILDDNAPQIHDLDSTTLDSSTLDTSTLGSNSHNVKSGTVLASSNSESNFMSKDTSHLEDDAEEIVHIPQDEQLSAFYTMLAVWEEQNHISRQGHRQLVEVFQLAQDLDEVKNTPKYRDTLNNNFTKSLPLRKLRKVTVKLDATYLPSRTKLEESMLVFDIEDIVAALLSSPNISNDIYRGMAQYTDGPITNPWEARWWGESIRTTSGNYFRYPDNSPIFPSDFVKVKCTAEHCIAGGFQCEYDHMARVTYCGLDFTRAAKASNAAGKPIIVLQNVYERNNLPPAIASLSTNMRISQSTPGCTELVLVEDSRFTVEPKQLMHQIHPVTIDYHYDPDDPSVRPAPLLSTYGIRYVFNQGRKEFRVMKLTSPHRAELELKAYGRDHFVQNFTSREVISLPFQMYVDAFGLYRNMYRSLLGVYIIGEFFTQRRRLKKHGVIPLTLGPYGADIADIFKALSHIRNLDSGREISVNGRKVFVCTFIQCIVGDMPQQQELSGCLSHQANLPCRLCVITKDAREDLHFDIVKKGRYHEQHKSNMARLHSMTTITAKRQASTRLGIHLDEELMKRVHYIFPALDFLKTRPADAAHSEGQGLSRLLHAFLFKEGQSILTNKALVEVCNVYQTFTFPPGWERLQSPKRHLDSWRIADYLRGAIILPVLLRCWLSNQHIRPDCQTVILSTALKYFDTSGYIVPVVRFTAVDWIVIACRTFAQSVAVIFGKDRPQLNQEELTRIIINGRKSIQFFCQVLASESEYKIITRESNKNIRVNKTRGTTAHSQVGLAVASEIGSTYSPSVLSTVTNQTQHAATIASPDGSAASVSTSRRKQVDPKARGNQFLNWKGLPNIHIGLHLPEVIDEYGSCNLVSTLPGEGKHKEYKNEIRKTNHRDAASTLIHRENIKQTIYLLFAGSFSATAPNIHNVFQLAQLQCPGLARVANPRFEEEEEQEDERIEITACINHEKPAALHKIQLRQVRSSSDPLTSVESVRNEREHEMFLSMLKKAFVDDYGYHLGVLDKTFLMWTKKFAFTSR